MTGAFQSASHRQEKTQLKNAWNFKKPFASPAVRSLGMYFTQLSSVQGCLLLPFYPAALSQRRRSAPVCARANRFSRAQNHRTAWVGRDLQGHLVQPPCNKQRHLQLNQITENPVQSDHLLPLVTTVTTCSVHWSSDFLLCTPHPLPSALGLFLMFSCCKTLRDRMFSFLFVKDLVQSNDKQESEAMMDIKLLYFPGIVECVSYSGVWD